MLATGLSNREDVRTLEALASELEAKARAADTIDRPEVTH